MAVAKMKKVTVVCGAKAADRVADLLQREGAMQVKTAEELAAEPGCESADGLQTLRPRDEHLLAALDQLSAAIRYLEPHVVAKKSLLDTFVTRKRAVTRDLAEKADQLDWQAIYRRCIEDDAELQKLQLRESRLLQLRAALTEWNEVDAPLNSLRDTATCRVRLLRADRRKFDALARDLGQLGRGEHLIEQLSSAEAGGDVLCALIYHRSLEEAGSLVSSADASEIDLAEMASSAGFSPDMTPSEAIAAVSDELSSIEKKRAEIGAAASKMAEDFLGCLVLYDRMELERQKLEIQRRFLATERTVIFQGWVPERREAGLRDALERLASNLGEALECVSQEPEPGEELEVPVVLENPAWLRPFEVVTKLYGCPKYSEPDPTPLLAPFFFAFFGLALGDAGYGLSLLVLSYLALKKLDLPEGGKLLLRLLFACGFSTTFFGAITGSIFGNIVDLVPAWLEPLRTLRSAVMIFDPVTNPLIMLGISLAFGIAQVWIGVLIKMVLTIRGGDLAGGIFDQGSWLLLLGSLALWALAGLAGWSSGAARAFQALAVGGALMVAYGASRGQPSILLKPFTGAYALYGITGYLGDVLSYARLLALGLATGIIGMVINQIALLPRGVPVVGFIFMIVVMVGGHAFNLVVNTLGSFVHSARLQFVEFFTKFFEGGGRPFRPFSRDTRYTELR